MIACLIIRDYGVTYFEIYPLQLNVLIYTLSLISIVVIPVIAYVYIQMAILSNEQA